MLIAQAMAGTTEIAPPGFRGETHFSAGYLLAGWNLGAWRPAVRVDAFTTRQDPASTPSMQRAWQCGHAGAELATAGLVAPDRRSAARRQFDAISDCRMGLAPRQIDTQVQFNARVLF